MCGAWTKILYKITGLKITYLNCMEQCVFFFKEILTKCFLHEYIYYICSLYKA